MKILSQECQRLSKTYPESAALMREKDREVVTAWQTLLNKSLARNSKLVEAEQLQRYLNDFRDLRCEVCGVWCLQLFECVYDVCAGKRVMHSVG